MSVPYFSLQNPCSWLMKSQTTDSYDIISVGTELQWFVWKGLIKSKAAVSIECNQCNDEADCNYNGQCLDGECYCNEQYFGALCQFTKPCNVVRCEWLTIDVFLLIVSTPLMVFISRLKSRTFTVRYS